MNERCTLPYRVFRAKIRLMFQAMVTKLHSPRHFSSPRSRNWRKPRTDLMMPNTGSGVCLRKAVELLAFGRGQAVRHGFERRRVLRCRRRRGKASAKSLPPAEAGDVMRLTADRDQWLEAGRPGSPTFAALK